MQVAEDLTERLVFLAAPVVESGRKGIARKKSLLVSQQAPEKLPSEAVLRLHEISLASKI